MQVTKYFKSLNPKILIDSFSSRDFSKAVSMVIGMVVPIVIGVMTGHLDIGTFVTLGVVFASFSDTSGSLRLKVNGMSLATLLTVIVTLVMHFLKVPFYFFIPLLGILIFSISYLSIYGFRASLISFSGLFAIVLNMSSLSDSDLSIYLRLLLIAVGGSWYILLTLIRQFLFPKSATEYYLAESLKLTADYLEIRAKLIDTGNDRKELIKELLEKQQTLTENHETLRELVLSRRLGTGKSHYQARRSLVFRQAVDMLELAMANPVNYGKTDKIFRNNPDKMADFQEVMVAMGIRLRYIAKNLAKPKNIKPDDRIKLAITQIKKDIQELIKSKDDVNDREDLLALKNYWKYQNSQYWKITKIESLVKNKNKFAVERARQEDGSFFLTKQNYNWSTLKDNFSIRSSIFRHSLRIAVVGMIGYSLGIVLNLVNPYWILLTIIIIMRPNFGLTKERFKNRSIGTVFGGFLAFGVILLTHNPTVYAILAILCYTVGLSMVQRNYKAAATFITMYVLFIYALLNPEVFKFIQYRVLDTLIGAGLSFIGIRLLWPFWEIKSIDKTLKSAIEADREYLEEIAILYNKKGDASNAYKLSRKTAFLALSELSASFQRMTQEPRAQHESLNEVFQIVMLMHSFLASLASLGTYIVNNETTEATTDFNKVVEGIIGNLKLSEAALVKVNVLKTTENLTIHHLDEKYKEKLTSIAQESEFDINWEENSVKEEAHLIAEQFKWLMYNSHRMAKIMKTINFK